MAESITKPTGQDQQQHRHLHHTNDSASKRGGQWTAQPRPDALSQNKRIPHPADRQDPSARQATEPHRQRQDQDQGRIGFHIKPSARGGGLSKASCPPPIQTIQQQGRQAQQAQPQPMALIHLRDPQQTHQPNGDLGTNPGQSRGPPPRCYVFRQDPHQRQTHEHGC